MTKSKKRRPFPVRAFAWLRRKLLAGFLALFPLVFTVWIGTKFLSFLDNLIGKYFVEWFPIAKNIPGLGILALFLTLFLTGALVRSYLGRKLYNLYDGLLTQIPLARSLYSSVKRMVEVLAPEESTAFREVGLIEYPRKGTYAVVFVTQDGPPEVCDKIGKEMLSVFLPTTPNPTSGYLLLLPREDVIPLTMTVEEAMTFVVSAGIVTPAPHLLPAGGRVVTAAEIAAPVSSD